MSSEQELSSPTMSSPATGATFQQSQAATPTGIKRYRPAAVKTFQCRGYGECRMVFSRSEHLARHVRKHTGERPFTCHCGKQFSRLDNLRQHAQTVHSDKLEMNERMMRELTSLHASMAAVNKTRRRSTRPRTTSGYEAAETTSSAYGERSASPTSPADFPHSAYPRDEHQSFQSNFQSDSVHSFRSSTPSSESFRSGSVEYSNNSPGADDSFHGSNFQRSDIAAHSQSFQPDPSPQCESFRLGGPAFPGYSSIQSFRPAMGSPFDFAPTPGQDRRGDYPGPRSASRSRYPSAAVDGSNLSSAMVSFDYPDVQYSALHLKPAPVYSQSSAYAGGADAAGCPAEESEPMVFPASGILPSAVNFEFEDPAALLWNERAVPLYW